MAFPKALLFSALLGSAAFIQAAPTQTKCQLDQRQNGPIEFFGTPLSLGEDGDIVVGGCPLNFISGVCEYDGTDNEGRTEHLKGYLADANDATQCLTVSHLDQDNATVSFSDCRFNGAGDVWSSQSFAWTFQETQHSSTGFFNGENFNAINNTQPPIYKLKGQHEPDVDGRRGKLLVDYTPDTTTFGDSIQISHA